jgi:hypothetical protein
MEEYATCDGDWASILATSLTSSGLITNDLFLIWDTGVIVLASLVLVVVDSLNMGIGKGGRRGDVDA